MSTNMSSTEQAELAERWRIYLGGSARTAAGVAAFAGVARQTVARWIRDGELHAGRVGARGSFHVAACDAAQLLAGLGCEPPTDTR